MQNQNQKGRSKRQGGRISRAFLIEGALAVFVALLAPARGQAAEERRDLSWDFPAQGAPVNLAVRVGDIRIFADAKDRIKVRATRVVRAADREQARRTIEETPVRVQLRDLGIVLTDIVPDRLRRGGRQDAPQVELKVEVHLPPGGAVLSKIDVGDTRVEGAVELLDLRTGNGKVRLERLKVQRSAQISVGVGDIEIAGAAGDLTVAAGTGSIRAERLEAAGTRAVGLRAKVGDITASFLSLPTVELKAIAETGTVRIAIPRRSRGEVVVTTASGTVRSDFTLGVRPKAVGDVGGTLYGPIGGGSGTRIRVQSGIGDAILSRR